MINRILEFIFWVGILLVVNHYWPHAFDGKWVWFVLGVGVGFAITTHLVFHFLEVDRKHPYSWTCTHEGCKFKVSTSHDPTVVVKVAEIHEKGHVDI
jgi:hypothetical protein